MLLVAAVVTVAMIANLSGGGDQGNHMTTVTWRAGRLAIWFSWNPTMMMRWWQWMTFCEICTKHLIAVRKSGSVDFDGIVRAALMPLQKQTVLSTFVKQKGAAGNRREQ